MPNSTCPIDSTPAPRRNARRGFTLAELLIVIAIIALLISILLPVVSRVRTAGMTADTSALIRAIDGACQTYHSDHQAWPGIFANNDHGVGVTAQFLKNGTATDIEIEAPATHAGNGLTLENVTGTENLVLSLLGGLRWGAANGPSAGDIVFDPAAVGRGPVRLGRTPGGHSAYLDLPASSLSTHAVSDADIGYGAATSAEVGLLSGRFVQDSTAAFDSPVPEFVDGYSQPMPILYLRAGTTGRITPDKVGTTGGRVIATDAPTGTGAVPGVYNQLHVAGYVGDTGTGSRTLGAGFGPKDQYHLNGAPQQVPSAVPYYHGLQLRPELTVPGDNTAPAALRQSMQKGANFTYPYDLRAYLLSPTTVEARQGDRYVLISAGADRIYGTQDDITSFGSVFP